MGNPAVSEPKIVTGSAGYVLEDVPHLSDYIADVPVILYLPYSLCSKFSVWFPRKQRKKKEACFCVLTLWTNMLGKGTVCFRTKQRK